MSRMCIFGPMLMASLACVTAFGQAPIQLPSGEEVATTSPHALAKAVSAAAKANPANVELTVKTVAAQLGKGEAGRSKATAMAGAAVAAMPGKAIAIVKAAVRANPALACSFVVGAIEAAPKEAAAIAQAAAAIVPKQAAAIAEAAVRAAPNQAEAIVAAVQSVTESDLHEEIAAAAAAVMQQIFGQWNQFGSPASGPKAAPSNIGDSPNEKNNNGKTISDNQG